MAWSRASSLDRTLICPGHLTLPHTRELSPGALNAAEYGNLVHRWAETGIVSGSKSHTKTFEKKLALLETAGVTRESIWPATGWHEVTFAYNCVDGRLGVCWLKGEAASDFKRIHNEDWITGTADYLYEKDGLFCVDDLKTGMMFDSTPDELSQLYFYLMCWQKYNRNYDDGILSVVHWPKYPLDTLPVRDEARVSADTMHKFEECLRDTHRKYMVGEAPFVMSSECDWCPAQSDCPLLTKNGDNDE